MVFQPEEARKKWRQQILLFLQTWEAHTTLLLSFCWPELSDLTTLRKQGNGVLFLGDHSPFQKLGIILSLRYGREQIMGKKLADFLPCPNNTSSPFSLLIFHPLTAYLAGPLSFSTPVFPTPNLSISFFPAQNSQYKPVFHYKFSKHKVEKFKIHWEQLNSIRCLLISCLAFCYLSNPALPFYPIISPWFMTR